MAMMPLQSNAQFFKKLGKALDKVGKNVDKALGTDTETTSASTSTASDGTKVINKLPGFTVVYNGVKWYKDFCGIEFTVTNNGSKAERVYYFDKMKTFDSDGTEYSSRSFVGKNLTSLGNGDFDFEPGVPVKCIYALFDIPENGVKMSLCQLRVQMHDAKKGYQDRYIEFRNVPTPKRDATTAAAQAASGPFKGKWKSGNESVLTLDFYGKSIDGTDADYNDIKCYGSIYISFNNASQVDESSVVSWKADGNKANIEYIGGRDQNKYSAVLTYNTSDKSMTISNIKQLTGEAESGQSFVTDGMKFTK